MTKARPFLASATDRQPQRFVVGAGDSLDEVQTSGEWLATDSPAEVRR